MNKVYKYGFWILDVGDLCFSRYIPVFNKL